MRKIDLYKLAVDSSHDLSERYEAARLLQSLNLSRVDKDDVHRLSDEHDPAEIAEKLNVNYQVVNGIFGKYRIWERVCAL